MSELMNDLMTVLWRQSWQLIILVALVWPVARFSHRKYPRFAYLLWLTIAIKTLLPLQFSVAAPLRINFPATANIFKAPDVSVWGSSAAPMHPTLIIACIWFLLVLFMAIRLLITELRFRAGLRNLQDYHDSRLPDLIQKFMLGKSVRIASCEQVTIPLTLGFRKPIILLPAAARRTGSKDILPVIAHELAHIKRRDIWAIGLQVGLNIIFFFHPLMRVVNRQLDLNRERICDELALQALGMEPRNYGKELLSHIEASLTAHPRVIMSGGLFMNQKNVLKRFEFLINRKGGTMLKIKWEQKLILAMVVMVMGVLACSDDIQPGMDQGLVSPESAAKETNQTYDQAPEPLGGFAAIQHEVVYPELARRAGIQGTVIVEATIGVDGKTRSTKILQGVPDGGLDEAASRALMAVEWKPGMFQGEAVEIKVAVPVVFRLADK